MIKMNSIIIEKFNSPDLGELNEVVFLGDSISVGTGIGCASYVETLHQEFGEPWNSPSIYLNNLGVTGRQVLPRTIALDK